MDQNQLRLLAIASQLGFGIAGPLIVFIVGGIFLDKKVGTSPLFLLIGVVFGMIGAGYAIFDLVKKLPIGPHAPEAAGRTGIRSVQATCPTECRE